MTRSPPPSLNAGHSSPARGCAETMRSNGRSARPRSHRTTRPQHCSQRRHSLWASASSAERMKRLPSSTVGSETRTAPAPGSGFVLLALKGRLLEAGGNLEAAAAAFERASQVSLSEGLFVVAAISLAGLARVQYLGGAWDDAVVSGERAIALALESEDRWVIAHARSSAAHVPLARGDWPVAEALQREVDADDTSFERHLALQAITSAQLAAAQQRPSDALAALSPLAAVAVERRAHRSHVAAVAAPESARPRRRRPTRSRRSLHHATPKRSPLRARTRFSPRGSAAPAASLRSHAINQPPHSMPSRTRARSSSRWACHTSSRSSSSRTLNCFAAQVSGVRRPCCCSPARDRLAALSAPPGPSPLRAGAHGLRAGAGGRTARDFVRLTPQETAVARLVVSGMTNREVSKELMLSTKTVEFHLSNIYLKTGVRSRSELRTRARAEDLDALTARGGDARATVPGAPRCSPGWRAISMPARSSPAPSVAPVGRALRL